MKPFSSWISGVWVLAIILGFIGASCAVQATTDRRPLTASEPDAATKAKVQAAYGKLPLSFEVNQGQSDHQVKFLSRGSGYTLFLTPTEAVLALHKPALEGHGDAETRGNRNSGLETRNSRLETVVRMKLVGANPSPQVAGLDELPGKSNYFIGNDPKNWHTNVPTYARVQYKDIYPGIDLIYYGNQRQLEYDFVAQPSWLRAGWKPAPLGERGPMPNVLAPSPLAGETCPERSRRGQDGGRSGSPLRIDDNGDLILCTACGEPCRTTGGELRLHKPRIYQEINGIKQPIPSGYVLLSPHHSSLITFQVAAYDTTKPLIIDPTLSYSTYLGGRNYDYGQGIAVDSSGNAYVTGDTYSTNFPTANPLQVTVGGGFDDVFVAKLNASGSTLLFSTYLGGSDYDYGRGIAVDSSGNAYVTGDTSSTNFPTANPLQATFGGFEDAFVAKIEEEREGICPATAALEEDPQKEIKLEVLYDFRDEVLASTPTGQRYIELFYKHAEEGVGLMFSYPELLSHTRTLLERFLPTLQAIVAGQEVMVTAADLVDIEALLEAFAVKASPGLQADLRAIQEELRQGALLDQFGIVVR